MPPEYNPNTDYFNNGAGQSINSSTLSPTPELSYLSPKTVPVYPVKNLNADVEGLFDLTGPENEASSLISKLTSLNSDLVGESSFRSQQENAQGVPELKKSVTDLSSRLKTIQNEAEAIPLQLQQEATGRGITEAGLRPIQTSALRNNAIAALSTSSLLESAKGNLTTALDLADRAVKQKYDPIREEIATNSANLDLILKSPAYSQADKQRAQKQKEANDAKQRAIENEEENSKTAHAMAAAAITNNPGNQAASLAAQQALSLDPADPYYLQKLYSLVGQYQTDPTKVASDLADLDLKRANAAKLRADTALTEAQRAKVLAETAPANDPKKAAQNAQALSLAVALRKDDAPGKGSAVGASIAKFVPYGQALGLQGNRTAFESRVDSLKANLTLDNLKLLKGAMSDKDLLFLNSIGSSLNVNMSEEQFNSELDKIIKKFEDNGVSLPEDAGSPESASVGSTVTINGKRYRKVGADAYEPL
ncbi:hypothetical protein [Dongia sp.]|uniref:hypothetical protein n=1 Tax=Dongia sp. TaxID=1977262 RepID=UPI0037532C86